MTLNEAIEKEKLVAVVKCNMATAYHTDENIYSREEEICRQKAEYHGQIAEWLKDYKRLLEQEPVLDKIKAEIEKAVWEDVIVSLDGTDEVRIPRLEPDDVFEIIDKYKIESEDEE